MLRRFNNDFKKDESGRHRDWRSMEEPKIRDLFNKHRGLMEEMIHNFKYIRIPRMITAQAAQDMNG